MDGGHLPLVALDAAVAEGTFQRMAGFVDQQVRVGVVGAVADEIEILADPLWQKKFPNRAAPR